MILPVVYSHNGVLMLIRPGYIGELKEDLPELVMLLSDVPYEGRYLTLKQSCDLRRISYATDTVDTLEKAISICNLFNRVGSSMQPYVYGISKVEIDIKTMWVGNVPPSITTTDVITLEEPDITRLAIMFTNLRFNIMGGRTWTQDLDLIRLFHPHATEADLLEVYNRL